jgi:site-specific DNA-adenine methylase
MVNAIFKFAGGKGKMLGLYEPFFRGLKSPGVFIDYFGGTGIVSIWFAKMYPYAHVILNEKSEEIYNLWVTIRDEYTDFMTHLKDLDAKYSLIRQQYKPEYIIGVTKGGNKKKTLVGPVYENRKEMYLSLRDRYANKQIESKAEKYATLYFMLRTNNNGWWQSRACDGIYYTPFGNGNEVGSIIKLDALNEFHHMSQRFSLVNNDYIDLIVSESNSVHYFDPPYINSSTKFSGEFTARETKSLCDRIARLAAQGATVFFSNKTHNMFEERLTQLRFETFNVRYTASANFEGSGSKAIEFLAHNNLFAHHTAV